MQTAIDIASSRSATPGSPEPLNGEFQQIRSDELPTHFRYNMASVEVPGAHGTTNRRRNGPGLPVTNSINDSYLAPSDSYGGYDSSFTSVDSVDDDEKLKTHGKNSEAEREEWSKLIPPLPKAQRAQSRRLTGLGKVVSASHY